MAANQQRRQKKLERKQSKRKAVHKELARQKQGGLATEFARVASAPVLDCLVADSIWEHGMGTVLLSRELRNGQVAFANFLIDAYCLGVKDVHADIRAKADYRDRIRSHLLERGSYQPVSPSHLRKLVESAVAYAHDLGFAPHKDYQIGKELFGNIDASVCDIEFEFGRDGKPCFISGPNDSLERSQRIVSTLTDRCGSENFHFTIGSPAMPIGSNDVIELDPDDMDAGDGEDREVHGHLE